MTRKLDWRSPAFGVGKRVGASMYAEYSAALDQLTDERCGTGWLDLQERQIRRRWLASLTDHERAWADYWFECELTGCAPGMEC